MNPSLSALLLISLIASRWWISDLQSPENASAWSTLAALTAIAMIWRSQNNSKPNQQILFDMPLGLTLLALVSSLWSLNSFRSMNSAVLVSTVAVLFWIMHRRNVLPTITLAWTVAISSAIASALALHQFFVGFPILRGMLKLGQLHLDSQTSNTIMAGRAFGSFYAPDMLGAALAMAILLTIGLFFYSHNYMKLVSLLLILCQIAGLASTRSVGALVTLLAGLFILFLMALQRLSRKNFNLSLIASGVVMVLVFIPMRYRLLTAGYRLFQRLRNQYTAVQTWKEAPFLGHGFDSFGLIQPVMRQPNEALTRYAHGWLGQNFSDLGLFGGLLALSWFVIILIVLWKLPRKSWLQLGAIAAVISGLLHALIDYDLLFGENLAVLMSVLIIALGKKDTEKGDSDLIDTKETGELKDEDQNIKGAILSRLGTQIAPYFVAFLAICLLVFSVWRALALTLWQRSSQQADCALVNQELLSIRNWGPPSSDLDQKLAKRFLACSSSTAQDNEHALQLLSQALQKSPHDAILRGEYALVLARMMRKEPALHQINLALTRWPRAGRLWNQRAQIAFILGDKAHVEEYLEKSAALDPHDPQLERTRAAIRAAQEGRPPLNLRKKP